jgi:uncharacterized protein (TIRG00374 family)
MAEDQPQPSKTKMRAKVLTTVAVFAVAAVLLYYSLRGIDWHQVFRLILGAKPINLVAICALGTVALFIRAFRWRILLNAEHRVRMADAFWATAAGYFGNNFLPARAGEFVRTLMISSRSPLSKTYVLTTAFAERAADGIALVVITGIVLIFLPGKTPWLADASRGFAVIGLTGVFLIALLPMLEGVAIKLIRAMPISENIQDTAIHLFEHSLRGLRAFHDWKRLAGFIALTIVIWCFDATSTVIGGNALGFDISYPIAFLLIAALGLSSALPSAPGYVGVWQFVAVMVLTPFGFSKTQAITYILLFQALNYLMVGLWGSVGFVQYRRISKTAATEGASAKREYGELLPAKE